MKKLVLLVTLCFGLNIGTAWAWGSKGHKIVSDIAKSLLSKQVVDSVQFYLDDVSFQDASVWMDEIRSDHSYDYMKPMHYVNVERDKTYVDNSDANIINELELVISGLSNRKNTRHEDIKNKLLILFHLAGDIHQPLHVGYGDDKGGNAISLEYKGTPSNLHRIWDSNIIDDRKITTQDCLNELKNFSTEEKKEIEVTDVKLWMNSSRRYLNQVYGFNGSSLDEAYIDKNAQLIKKQLAIGGMRLALVLNQLFATSADKPVEIKSLQPSNK